MQKGYFGERGAQIHYRLMGAENVKHTPLICLPPAPHTGAYFDTIIPLLAQERQVLALDYPGYGGSDRLDAGPTIDAYARSLSGVFGIYPRIDLLGFHTGNLVAMELTKQNPDFIGQIVMVDVPFFQRHVRQKHLENLAPDGLPADILSGFEKSVTHRHDQVEEGRAFALWVESLRSGAFRSEAFRAAFSYDCETEFLNFNHDVTIIATQSGQLEPSHAAAKTLPKATIMEALNITAPVFEAHGQAISRTILLALNS